MRWQFTTILSLTLTLTISSCISNPMETPEVPIDISKHPNKISKATISPKDTNEMPKSDSNSTPSPVPSLNIEIESKPTSTPNPTPTPSPSISYYDTGDVWGIIYDDLYRPIEGVLIKITSYKKEIDFSLEMVTEADGKYRFENVPLGVIMEMVATKVGYTTRRRVEVPGRCESCPNRNWYNFGRQEPDPRYTYQYSEFGGTLANALSDKPEVNIVSPGRNSNDINPSTNFNLKFSEPIKREEVEDTFSIRAFLDRSLTIDNVIKSTFKGSQEIMFVSGDVIFDKEAFNIKWNSNNTEVIFSFKDGLKLPSDKDKTKLTQYQIVFNNNGNRAIEDMTGIERSKEHFKLTDGPLEESYKFRVTADTTRPKLIALEKREFPSGLGFKLTYSEPMLIPTKSLGIAGGMSDRFNTPESEKQAPAEYPDHKGNASGENVAKNYHIRVFPVGSKTETYEDTWANLGGLAIYDPDGKSDTVILKPTSDNTSIFNSGDRVEITVAPTVVDPAGNEIGEGATASVRID